jgi:serine phosphatase RsbU (regulator of sigma subunit)
MARPRTPTRPLPDFLRLLWRSPLIALPFGAFFLLVSGGEWRAFPGYWLAALVFTYGTSICVWLARHTLQARVLKQVEGDPRSVFVLAGLYVLASILGVAIAGVIMNFTLMPGLFASLRSVVLLVTYTLVFGVLFVGLALASSLYRKTLDRVGAERELALARRIQRSFLLSEFPRRPRLEVHALNVSSKEVSGDFYDVVATPGDGVLLAIADVSGKGVPAALLSSMLQASLRTQAGGTASPAAMMGIINTLACQRDTTGQFATFFLASIHEPSMTLRFTNAGHNFPVLVRAGSERMLLETGGLIVGMREHVGYEEGTLVLEPGDRLVLYTDGVTEAENAAGEMYGEERLYALLDAVPAAASAEETVDRVLAGVRGFLAGTEAGDDITVMALRVLPAPGAAPPA